MSSVTVKFEFRSNLCPENSNRGTTHYNCEKYKRSAAGKRAARVLSELNLAGVLFHHLSDFNTDTFGAYLQFVTADAAFNAARALYDKLGDRLESVKVRL